MREAFDELKAKCARLRTMEAEAETLRGEILLRDDAAAKDRAAALMAGTEPGKRDKKADADRQRLADIDATLPHARVLVSEAAVKFRNELAAKLSTASGNIAKNLDKIKAGIQARIVEATNELNELLAGPEIQVQAIIGTGSRLLELNSPGEIVLQAESIFADHADIFESEPVEACAK